MFVTSIAEAMSSGKRQYEILLICDINDNQVEDIIGRLAGQNIPVRGVICKKEQRISAAILQIFNEASGDYLVCMNAGLGHSPSVIPAMLEILERGEADFVLGNRYLPDGAAEGSRRFIQRLKGKFAAWSFRAFTNVGDPTSEFFALPRQVFQSAKGLDSIGYKAGLELIVKCGCDRICEIPIQTADRKLGESIFSLGEQINYLKQLKYLADFKYGTFSRFFQFCLVGGSGMGVDLVTYALLLTSGISLSFARGVAIWVAMTWNFWLNRHITFSYSRDLQIYKQYFKFVCSCLLGALLSWAISMGLSFQTDFFHKHLLSAAVIGIVIGTISNFALSLFWVFKHKK